MKKKELKKIVRRLRSEGQTYSEIMRFVRGNISKSTISVWCRDIIFSPEVKVMFNKKIADKLQNARLIALNTRQKKREEYIRRLKNSNLHLLKFFNNKNVAKIALVTLYLCEGSKNRKGALVFCNSDPLIIGMFLQLLRKCYSIDEKKFRFTLQCRADQKIKGLEKFWSQITDIPRMQFYKARIDARTIGKPSKKKNYKGVCRIDYFSAEVYNDLIIAGQLFSVGP